MNLAVVGKTTRDTLPLLLVTLASIVVFEVFFVRVMSELAAELLGFWTRQPGLKRLIQMLVGGEVDLGISSTGLITIGFVHPLLFALTWTFILTSSSRVIAAEIDRGTADLLLALPVSRASYYLSVSGVWLVCTALLAGAPLFGLWLGERQCPLKAPLDYAKLALVAVNFLLLLLAIFSAGMLASACFSRRSAAIAVVLGGLLLSLLINFLAQFWPPAERFGFLGLLDYYRPLNIVRASALSPRDLAVLAGITAACWVGGLWRFCARDIPAA
ncbi:MAG: ABC transporter permease [Phycisphaerae bacterium]|jgi:ABC-type transport system involved in multi-copper enzyme maturation permease subunit|nr:ABC transporter permease subunit [Phycisphaerae bacterium]MCZ2401433.1 ABC transporter permease [Phycisphaerae bacterium]NUQ49570.1 ABC transporter permease subunit [Phycisphaerae bacterium]